MELKSRLISDFVIIIEKEGNHNIMIRPPIIKMSVVIQI
jgi:hypothetical protein